MIQCYIFDADGVAIDNRFFSREYQKVYGVSNEEMLPFFEGVFKDCLIGKRDLKVELKLFLKDWRWKGDVDSFLLYWFEIESIQNRPLLDAIQVLRAEGFLCFLATNQEKYRTRYIRKDMGFSNLFDGIFSSGEVGFTKPNRRFYESVFKNIQKKNRYPKMKFSSSMIQKGM